MVLAVLGSNQISAAAVVDVVVAEEVALQPRSLDDVVAVAVLDQIDDGRSQAAGDRDRASELEPAVQPVAAPGVDGEGSAIASAGWLNLLDAPEALQFPGDALDLFDLQLPKDHELPAVTLVAALHVLDFHLGLSP